MEVGEGEGGEVGVEPGAAGREGGEAWAGPEGEEPVGSAQRGGGEGVAGGEEGAVGDGGAEAFGGAQGGEGDGLVKAGGVGFGDADDGVVGLDGSFELMRDGGQAAVGEKPEGGSEVAGVGPGGAGQGALKQAAADCGDVGVGAVGRGGRKWPGGGARGGGEGGVGRGWGHGCSLTIGCGDGRSKGCVGRGGGAWVVGFRERPQSDSVCARRDVDCVTSAGVMFCLRMGVFRTWLWAAGMWCGALVLLALTGCGGDVVRAPAPDPVAPAPLPPATMFAGAAFTGVVRGAGLAVAGATVQLYAAGAAGTGVGASALLSAGLVTDANGAFRVPAGYLCPSASTQVYVVARGGRAGGGAGSNAALAEMTVLGTCQGIASGAAVVVDEATTVAAVWALNRFMAADGMIGASATNAGGLGNAVRMAEALVNVGTGTAPGVGFGVTVTAPTAKVNTLGNLLSRCAADAGSAGCGEVLAGGTGDTLAAAVRIARAPAANVAALFEAGSRGEAAAGAGPYAPALGSQPRDWMLAVTYTGGGLEPVGSTTLALDAGGNAWVTNYAGVLSAFSPLGEPLFPAGISGGGLNSVYGMAIDAGGGVWVANSASAGGVNGGKGSVTLLNASGQAVSGANGFTNSYEAGGFNFPLAVAIDGTSGPVWVVNTGNATVTQVNRSGGTISGGAGYGAGALAFPSAIALDAGHNAWVGNMNAGQVVKISQDGKTVRAVNCCDGPQGLAIDASGYLWAANYYGSSVTRVAVETGAVMGAPITGATLQFPEAIAVDGAGSVWVASFRGNVLTQLAGSDAASPGAIMSPAAGWAGDADLNQPFALAVDASGDVWVSNFAAGTVTELIGVAGPVKTPLLGPVRQP